MTCCIGHRVQLPGLHFALTIAFTFSLEDATKLDNLKYLSWGVNEHEVQYILLFAASCA